MQLASSLLIHSLVQGVHFVDIHFFSLFSKLGVTAVDFLDNSYVHVVYTVALLVEMVPCSLVKMMIFHITPMF